MKTYALYLELLANWVIGIISATDYTGIFLLMAIESYPTVIGDNHTLLVILSSKENKISFLFPYLETSKICMVLLVVFYWLISTWSLAKIGK